MHRAKVAVVGYGFIAENGHVPAYRARGDVDVVAIVDGSPARRARAAAAFPGARLFAAHEELFGSYGGALDIVDVCAPPYVHASAALAALDAGLHVLCEKPLATNAADARAMLDRARTAKRVLFPAHNYRHAPVIKLVRAALEEGRIGDVRLVTLETFRPTHARGVADWNPDWRRDPAVAGGGIAMDHGPHTFYLAFEWLRAHPTAISATTTYSGAATEETFAARILFPTGQANAMLTWAAGLRRVIYTLHGARGAVRVEDDAVQISIMNEDAEARRWEVIERVAPSDWADAGHGSWFLSLFDDLDRAIAREEHVPASAHDALVCIELIEAGYRSARANGAETSLER